MALRKVVQHDDFDGDILRKKSKPVANFDENLWELIDDMWDTMYENDGVGLAAVQVGVLRQVIVADINNMTLELINAKILEEKGTQLGVEGCLSIQNVRGKVERPKQVTVQAFDRFGNQFTIMGENELAVCLCHEIDHTEGVLFTDKMLEEKEE